jgi:hypothetical protein
MQMANQNEYLVYGWSAQQLGASAGQSGYGQPGVVPAAAALASALQTGAGLPYPVGAENVQGENAGSQSVQILTNPGYADGNTQLGAITAPTIPASTVAVQNPSGLASIVTVVAGTVSAIATAPWAVNAGAATFTTVNPGETGTETQVTVPGGGFIKLTYSVVPTSWSWVTTN